MSAKLGVDFLKTIADYCAKSSGYDAVTKCLRITGGGSGRCIGEFTVNMQHLNSSGILHGGFTSTLIDNVTTYALMTTECHPGISVNLFVNYLETAKEGDLIIIDANTLRIGKNFAVIKCILKRKTDNTIIAEGGQTKYINI